MKCVSCGIDVENGDACPNCGAPITPTVAANPVTQWMLTLFKDKLFLILCILLSVSCGFQLLHKEFPLIEGLIAVFLWVVFARARKDIASTKYLRAVSGTVFAQYVVLFVLSGLLALLGAVISIIFSMASHNTDLMNKILDTVGAIDEVPLIKIVIATSGAQVFRLFALMAILLMVFNLLSMRPMHRLAKSVYQCLDQGIWELEKVDAAKGWLWVLSILSGISVLSSLIDGEILAALGMASITAARIVAALLIGRYAIPIIPIKNSET